MEQSDSQAIRLVCSKSGVLVSDEQASKLEEFVSLLLQANRSLNLISRKDEQNVWTNHILHSISPSFLLSFGRLNSILDLGSGGGLPGIPLKILFPSTHVALVDSIRKKTQAVEDIVGKLDLTELSVVCSRAEDLPKRTEFSHAFDAVICRAVAPLDKLIDWSFPLLKPSEEDLVILHRDKTILPPGSLLAFKGGELEREISKARRNKRVRDIYEIPLVFQGSEVVSLTDKKILIVRFNP